jgi:hypothetical protein
MRIIKKIIESVLVFLMIILSFYLFGSFLIIVLTSLAG